MCENCTTFAPRKEKHAFKNEQFYEDKTSNLMRAGDADELRTP